MTNEEHLRLTAALARKVRPIVEYVFDDPDGDRLHMVVGTVIADTVCVLEGVTRIEDYE